MAVKKKKVGPPAKPVVSKIPMPPSESALVIDLPDGQKLVVGKMEHGTVIEVATWRGTGRPDSRTNRMMLGMTNAELEASIEAAATGEAPVNNQELKSKIGSIKKDPKQFIINILKMVLTGIKWLFNFKEQFGGDQKPPKQQKNIVEPKASEISIQNSGDNESDVSSTSQVAVEETASKFNLTSRFKTRESEEQKVSKSASSDPKEAELEDWLDQIMSKAQAKVEKSSLKDSKTTPATKTPARKPNTIVKKSTKRR